MRRAKWNHRHTKRHVATVERKWRAHVRAVRGSHLRWLLVGLGQDLDRAARATLPPDLRLSLIVRDAAIADWFYAETRVMRPGKSVPPEMAGEYSGADRERIFREWIGEKYAAARLALADAIDESEGRR